MSGDAYLQGVIGKYTINPTGAMSAANSLLGIIRKWANQYLSKIEFSGSLSKGTAISLSADADLFISLTSVAPDSLSDIYNTLYNAITAAAYTARKQNVSVGVNVNGYKVDLVPGKRQSQFGNDHSIYRSKAKTWTKTNINTHISYVKSSNRAPEIKLTKIWRELHNLDFPSFYLEMAVIDALKNRRTQQLATNFLTVLEFFRDELPEKRYIDPANSNNIISDDLILSEKRIIATQAKTSRNNQYWKDIVW